MNGSVMSEEKEPKTKAKAKSSTTPKKSGPRKKANSNLINKLDPKLAQAFREKSEELKERVYKDNLEDKIKRSTTSPIKIIVPGLFGIVVVLAMISYFNNKAGSINPLSYPRIAIKGEKAITPENSILPKELTTIEESFYTNTPKDPLLKGGYKGVQNQKLASIKHKLPLEIKNELNIGFRLIPDGSFIMGSPENEPDHSESEYQHEVAFKYPFYMGKYEISVKEWLSVMDELPHNSGRDPNLPVTSVSLNDCLKFVQKLNELRPKSANFKYFMPSEEEWEYACRAGTETAFSFGPAIVVDDYAVHRENTKTHNFETVGGKLPNPWGLYDMHGNASEWTRTPFFLYACNEKQYAGINIKAVDKLKLTLDNLTIEQKFGSETRGPTHGAFFGHNRKMKSDEELLQMQSWDFAIYDGEHPENLIMPLDKFNVPVRAIGANVGIFYHDFNKNGKYDKNEAIWKDHPDKGKRKHFDKDVDILIVSYAKVIPEGTEGLNNGIFYHDKDQSFEWNAGEELWAYSEQGRIFQAPYIHRGGSYYLWASFARSAVRLQSQRQNPPKYAGLRICMYLNSMPRQESTEEGDNSTPFK